MVYKAERIENLDELESIHMSLYMNAMRLRALLEEPEPSIPQIEEIAKSMHMDALKAKDFDFIVTQRTIKEENDPISKCSCKYAVRPDDESVPRPH